MICKSCGAGLVNGLCPKCASAKDAGENTEKKTGSSEQGDRTKDVPSQGAAVSPKAEKYRAAFEGEWKDKPDSGVVSSKPLFFSGANKGSLALFIVISAICLCLIFLEARGLIGTIGEYIHFKELMELHNSTSASYSGMIITMIVLSVLIAAETALVIFIMTRIRITLSCFVISAENGVYGRGISNKSRRVEPFCFAYDKVTKVYRSGVVIIESGESVFQCDVGKRIDTVGEIRLNLMKYFKENICFAWVCKKCGKVNINVSEKCDSCGRLKRLANLEGK